MCIITCVYISMCTYLCACDFTYSHCIIEPAAIYSAPPPSVNGTVGKPFSLTCKATGRPPPTVKWLYQTRSIPDLEDPTVTDHSNGTLSFSELKQNHSGTYLCFTMMQNSEFIVTSPTTLNVLPEASNGYVAGLNKEEAVLIFGLASSIGFMFLIACIMLIITVLCLTDTSLYRAKYHVTKETSLEEEDGEGTKGFLRTPSMRSGKDNSGILTITPSIPIFDTLRRSSERNSEEMQEHSFPPSSPNNIPLQTFHPDRNSYAYTSHSSSMDQGTTSYTISPSHKPTTFSSLTHVTHTPSNFTSELSVSHSFPRNYIKVGVCRNHLSYFVFFFVFCCF